MPNLRPVLLFFVAATIGCLDSSPQGPRPIAPTPPMAPPTGPSPAAATPTPVKTQPAKAPEADITRIKADKVRLMMAGPLEVDAVGDDAAGTQKTCTIRFVVEPSGKPASAELMGCDEKYTEAIQAAAMLWHIQPVEGKGFPSRVEVLWDIRYKLK